MGTIMQEKNLDYWLYSSTLIGKGIKSIVLLSVRIPQLDSQISFKLH